MSRNQVEPIKINFSANQSREKSRNAYNDRYHDDHEFELKQTKPSKSTTKPSNSRNYDGSDSDYDEKSNYNRNKSQPTRRQEETKRAWPDDDQPSRLDGRPTIYLFACLIVAAFGASFQAGWTSNIMLFRTDIKVLDIIQDFTTTDLDLIYLLNGFFAAFYPLGAVFGAIFSGYLANGPGRKGGLLVVNIFAIIGAALTLFLAIMLDSITVVKFISGPLKLIVKLACGFYMGFFSGIIPIYLSELPTQNFRGLSGMLNQAFILFGSLICALVGPFQLFPRVGYQLTTTVAGLLFLPVAVHIGLFFLSESPAYLVYKRKPEKAKEVLEKLRYEGDNQLVENEMKELTDKESNLDNSCCTRVFWIMAVIQMAHHFTGIYPLISAWPAIMATSGSVPLIQNYVEIIMGTQLGINLIAMFLVDRIGRKLLLIIGYSGIALSSILIAVGGSNGIPDMAVVCAFFFIIFYAMGPGPIAWLIAPECVPLAARGKTMSGLMVINWLSYFIIMFISPYIFSKLHFDSFYIFGGLSIVFALFVWILLPETKKKSTSEIVKIFNKESIFIKNLF